MTGTIVMWNKWKGFGFVQPDGVSPRSNDHYFHENAVPDNMLGGLEKGARVDFEPDPKSNKRKPQCRLMRFL